MLWDAFGQFGSEMCVYVRAAKPVLCESALRHERRHLELANIRDLNRLIFTVSNPCLTLSICTH